MLRRSSTVRAKAWVWKRGEAKRLCGLLWDPGRGFACCRIFPLPTLTAYYSLRSLILFFHGSLAGWVRKTNWRKSPLSSGLLWHDLWWQPQEETVSWNPSFIESVLLGGKNCFVWWLYGKCWQRLCLHTERETFLTAAHEPHLFTLAHAHYLFIGFLSLLNVFQFWRLNHCQ